MNMRLKRIVVIVSMLIGFAVNGSCEELTWQDCVSEAKVGHPDLLSAKAYLRQAKASKAVTASTALPQISSRVSESSALSSTGIDSETYTYSLSGSQLIFDGLKTFYNIKSAEKSIHAAEFLYQTTSSVVRNSLRIAFVRLS